MEKQEYLNDGDRLAKHGKLVTSMKLSMKIKTIFVDKWKRIKNDSRLCIKVPEFEILQLRRTLVTFLSNFYQNGKLKCYHKQLIYESRLNKPILKQ